jgi:DNA end-binding protein Ku
MWKGIIQAPDLEVPVKLYAAAVDRGVQFHLLHRTDLQPVRQEMFDPRSGDPVTSEQIRKGALRDGQFVLLSAEELDALEPPAARDIEILTFVSPDLLDPAYYERPYFLGPDAGGEEAYLALRDALSAERAVAVVRWVMRRREYCGVLTPQGEALSLVTVRAADEVVRPPALEPSPARRPDPREVLLAEQLVDALSDDFAPEVFRDTYRDRVLELARRKARGERVDLPEPVQRAPVRSLERALQASLQELKAGPTGKAGKAGKAGRAGAGGRGGRAASAARKEARVA